MTLAGAALASMNMIKEQENGREVSVLNFQGADAQISNSLVFHFGSDMHIDIKRTSSGDIWIVLRCDSA